jgi:N12 class adenine-specific DNA methylase/2'-5' RNA ligase
MAEPRGKFSLADIDQPAAPVAGSGQFRLEDVDPTPAPGDGLLEPGNIDLARQPRVHNPDGTISTVRSLSFEHQGREVLIPTVSPDGRILSDEDAIEAYWRTGRHLGIFATPVAANAYAEQLHADYAAGKYDLAGPMAPGTTAITSGPPALAAPQQSGQIPAPELDVIARSAPVQQSETPLFQQALEGAQVIADEIRRRTAREPKTFTRGRFTGLPGASQLPQSQQFEPLTDGLRQMAHGAFVIAKGMRPAETANQPDARVPRGRMTGLLGEAGPPLPDETKAAAAEFIEGAFTVGSLLVPAALLEAPVTAAIGLGVATGAQKAGYETAKALGGSEQDARLTGDLAALAVATGAADHILGRATEKLAQLPEAAKAAARPRILAGQLRVNPPAAGETSGYGPGDVPGYRATSPVASSEVRPSERPPSEASLRLEQEFRDAEAAHVAEMKARDQATAAKPPTPETITERPPTTGAFRAEDVEPTSAEPVRPSTKNVRPSTEATPPTSGAFRPEDVDTAPTTTPESKPATAGIENIPAEREYSSTEIRLPAAIGTKLQELGARIPDAALAEDGRETTPHVTVKYGLHGSDPEAVRAVLANEPPIRVTLGTTSIFPNGESGSGDVVKVDVDSPDLHRLNAKIADALEHTDTFPNYQPHATIAYVKPGLGEQYAGDASLEGQTFTVDRIVFSGKDGSEIEIPLGGTAKPAPSATSVSAGAREMIDAATTPARARFFEVYIPALEQAHANGQFSWPIEDAPTVAARMATALRNGTANVQGPALRAAAKKLGIKNTSGAWKAFFAADAEKKPATPQLPPAGGPGYVLPSFVTAPHAQKADLKIGDRVTADEGTGEIHQVHENDVHIRLEPDGRLSKWIPKSRVTKVSTKGVIEAPAEAPKPSAWTPDGHDLTELAKLSNADVIARQTTGTQAEQDAARDDVRRRIDELKAALGNTRNKKHVSRKNWQAQLDTLTTAKVPRGHQKVTPGRADTAVAVQAALPRILAVYRDLPLATLKEDLEQLEVERDDDFEWPDHFPMDAITDFEDAGGPATEEGWDALTARTVSALSRLLVEREGQQGLPLPDDDAVTTTQPESRYAGDNVADLEAATEDEQGDRLYTIRALRDTIARVEGEDAGSRVPGHIKKLARLKSELAELETVYEATYDELADATGADRTNALRARVEGTESLPTAAPEPTVDTADEPGSEPAADTEPERPVPSGPTGAARPQRPASGRAPRASRGAGTESGAAGSESGPGAGTRAPEPVPVDGGPVGGRPGVRPDARRRVSASVATDLYRITDQDAIGTGTVRERITRNFAAIRVVKVLADEKRVATPEERAILVKYVGWGGIPRIFEPWKYDVGEERDDEYWRAQHGALTDLLTEDQYAAARNSTQNAHYTSPIVIQAMWAAVQRLGVTSGSVLEPSAGVGHFIGLSPDGLRGLAWAAVEKDEMSAAILAALYPGAFVQHAPFEASKLPSDHFTLAISNFPFGLIPITDAAFTGPRFVLNRIHNYFPAKALDKVAPGGLVAFVTTQGSLDSRDNEKVRTYLASRADFLGAIRLPFAAFKANAGTEVVTDIIFLRKRKDGEAPNHAGPWIKSQKAAFPNKEGVLVDQWVNEYILAHPEFVLGTHTSTGKQRADDQYNVVPPGTTDAERLAHWKAHGAEQLAAAILRLPAHVIDTTPPKKDLQAFTGQLPPEGSRPFEFVLHEGRIGQVTVNGLVEPVQLSGADETRIRGLLPIRTALRDVYNLMAADASDAELTRAQERLTKAYDTFVKKHGAITLEGNWAAFREDPDLPLLLSLEDYDEERKTVTKSAVFRTRTKRAERRATKANSPQQALTIALSETGQIDLPRVGELLGRSEADATDALIDAHLIVDTPSGWQLPALYLSGNVRVKLAEAQAAAALDPRYQTAATLLEQALPAPVPAHKIAVRLGSPWITPAQVDAFIQSIAPNSALRASYSEVDAMWGLEGSSPASRFETTEVDTKTLLLDALNDRRRVIKGRIPNPNGEGEISAVNKKATALVRQKRDDVHRAFATWLLVEDPARREAAVTTYNEKFNAYVEPKIDGAYLALPGMADYWRDHIAGHQRDAIARIVQLGNTLLAHVVGAGKTLAMVGGMMEMKRMGLARKPMMVVPNHLISQAPGQFLSYYPSAKVLVLTADDLAAERRKRITARIASGDWDAVIVPYSAFVRIPMSAEAEAAYQREILDQIETAILQAWAAEAQSDKGTKRGRDSGRTPPSVKRLENTRDRIQIKLDKLANRPKDDMLTFEQLGVDALFVDEAHSFKNLYFPTRQQAAGIPADNDAQRATDLYLKARYLNKLTHDRGIVLATGTPVSNSMAEVYVMQRLLQEAALVRAGVVSFDAWLAQFGTITTETELDPAGTGMTPRARLKRFRNLPVLAAMFRQIADVRMIDDLPELKKRRPNLKGGEIESVIVPMSDEQSALLDELLRRSNNLDPKDRRADNMPMITTDGRLGFLDMRLLDRRQPEAPNSKVSVVAKNVAAIYKENRYRKGTQLVFLDGGTPGSDKPAPFKWFVDDDGERKKRPLTEREQNRGFNLYADLAKKLERLGIPRTEIAFIHDIDKYPEKHRNAARLSLFRKVQRGEIRVLIGSTGKMGTGMNVQDRLVALHHVDPAWKPSDIEQRNGRILRQGNLFFKDDPTFEVRILSYLTEGRNKQFGFDAYMWQLNEAKATIISDFFRGDLAGMANEQADMDLVQTVATAAGLKAVATGNPAVVELTKAEAEYDRLRNIHLGWEDDQRDAQINVGWNRDELARQKKSDARDKATVAAVTPWEPGTTLAATISGEPIEGFKGIGEAVLALARKHSTETTAHIGEVSSWEKPVKIGTIRGLTATLERAGKDDASAILVLRHPDAKTPRYSAPGEDDSTYRMLSVALTTPDPAGKGGIAWGSPVGIIQSAMSKIGGLSDTNTYTQYYADRVARYEAVLAQPFEQQAELDAARTRVETLQASLGQTPGAQVVQEEEIGGGEEDLTTPPRDAGLRDSKKKPEGGTTLQATILPGAAEFGEYVLEPAWNAVAEEVRKNTEDLKRLFAPDTVSERSTAAAGILRANLAARAQRTVRARRLLRQVEKLMDGWSHDQSRAFWDVMEGLRPETALERDVRPIAELYRLILDNKRDNELLPRNLLRSYLENYWGHEWQQNTSAVDALIRKLFGKRPMQGPESYRKRRSIPTMREGLAHGLEPLSWNPTTQLLRKLLEMDKSIAAHDIKQELKASGLAKFVAEGKRAPDGWRRFPDSFGTVYGPQTLTAPESGEEVRIPFGRLVAGHYYGPSEVVRLLENHLSPGLRGKVALFDLYRTAGNFLNQLQLGLSAFHFAMVGMESIVSKQALVFELIVRGQFVQAAKAQVATPIAPLLDVVRGHKSLKAFYEHDANAAAIDDEIGQIVNAGGGFGWDLFEHAGAPEAFMRAFRSGVGAAKAGEMGRATGEAFRLLLQAIPAAVELTAKPIMEGWVPRLKIAAFLDLARMEMATLGPEPDIAEVRRVLGTAWDSIDNRFGQLRYDNLFWNNALKDLGMGSLRALGWNVGSVREMFGVVPGQLRQLGITGGGGGKPPTRRVNTGVDDEGEPQYEAQPESRLHRKTAWFLAMVIAYGLAGAIYMYLRTGKRPEDLKDYFFPKNGETDRDGRPVRVSIAGYFKDLYAVMHDLPGSAVTTAAHKLQPLLTMLYDILGNEDFFGNEIRSSDDPLVQQTKDVVTFILGEAEPISLQASRSGKAATPGRKVENFFGITPAPAAVTRTPLEQYLHDIRPPSHRTKQEAQAAEERRDLRDAMREGTPLPNPNEDHLSNDSFRQTLRSARRPAVIFGFQQATFQQALKAYDLASPDERSALRPYLARKVVTGVSQVPRGERDALMARYRAALALPYTQKTPTTQETPQ